MDKRNPAQRHNPGDSPGKYFGAIKAWVDDVDNLDDLEDIQLHGHVKANQTTSRDPNLSKIEKEPVQTKQETGEKVIDEANDNINVQGMLHNIMEALKVDTNEKKPETKKPVYEPLVRVKRVEQEPEKPPVFNKPAVATKQPVDDKKAANLQNPTINTQNKKKENDLQIVDFEKSPTDNQNRIPDHSKGEDSHFLRTNGFGSSVQPGGINPFAGAMFPASKLNDTQGHEKEPFSPPADQIKTNLFPPTNQKRLFEPNQSTIGDLSAIAVDTGINRETLDSRGSFGQAGLFGPGYKGGQDQILTPGIRIIDSPEGLAIHNAELDSGIFKKQETPLGSAEPKIGKRSVGTRNTTNDRESKVADLLADIVGKGEAGNTDDQKGKTKGKDKTKGKFGTFFGGGSTKNNDKQKKKNTNSSIQDSKLADPVEVNDLTNDAGNKEGGVVPAASARLQPEDMETKDGDDLFEAHKLPSQRIHLSGLPKDPVVEEMKSYRQSSNRASSRQSLQNVDAQKLKQDSARSEARDGQKMQEIDAIKRIDENPTQEDEQEKANKEQIPGRIVDETQETVIQNPNQPRPTSGMSTLFANDRLGNSMMLAKGKKQEGSEKSYPLSKQITGESELRFEEESPLMINFTKRDVQEDESIIIDHDESQAHEFLGEERRVKRARTIIELEEIDVPVSDSMINLFVGFRKKVNKLEYLVQEVRKPEYTLHTFFERNCTCFGGRIKITPNFFFTFLILTGIMLYFILDTLPAQDLSRVKNDEMKDFVASLFIPAAIIFTYYGMIFLHIPLKWLRLLVIAQILPCLGVIGASLGMTFVQDKAFSYVAVYVCAYIIGTNIFWSVTRALKNDISRNYSWAWSMFYMFSWCLLLPTAIIAYAIYVSVVSRRFNYGWAHDLIIHIGVPSMILLCLTWVYYHFKFFVPAAKKKAPAEKKGPTAKELEKENEEKLREQFGEISEDEEEQKEEEKKPLKLRIYIAIKNVISKISDIIIIASSFSLGGSLIFIEGVLLVYISEVTTVEKVTAPGAFYLAVFLFFFIPITVLFGVPVIATGKNHEKKMFIVPIIAILFPLFATMPIAYTLMNNNDNGHSIGLFLILAPAIATLFWLTMSYIGIRRKKTKFASLAFIFICFVIPLVILQPLIDINAFKAVEVAQGFAAFFLAVGIIILIVAALYWICRGLLIKEITQKDRLNTDNYKLINVFKTNLEPFGYWANSFGFIVNFTLSLYTFFHSPKDVSQGLNGMSLGLAFCFIIFYVYNAVALKVHVIEVHEISKYGIKSLSAAIIESVRNKELFQEMEAIRDANERIKGYCRIFTYFVVPITAIVSLAVASSSRLALGIFATICVGTLVIHIIFEIYGGIKIKYTNIAKSVIPLFLTYIWFTHFLAFPSVLQYTKVFFGDDIQRKKRIEVQLIVLVFVITVSLIAIIANIIFKGIELEQKIKYILAYMRKQLENIAVKSDYFVLQKVFEGWMEQGEQKLKKTLVNRGKPAFWWPVPATNPNTKYSKVLLDFDAYKYMKLRLKQKLDNVDGTAINTGQPKKKRGWLSKCFGCLGLCLPFLFKNKRAQYVDEELEEEIEELLDLQMHEVPLPPKEDGDASDEESDDDYDAGDLGDWKIESQIAENKIEITDIAFRPLDERVLRAMMYYDSGIKFAHNDKFTVDFLKFVFRLFAVGNYRFFKKRWLDYIGYKRFMILSAITPTAEFPDYMIDLTYTQYTHNVGRGQIQRRVDYSQKKQQAKKKPKKNAKEIDRDNKMRVKVFPIFEEDFEGFLIHIAKRRFPNEINDRDALYRLIRWHLFPNFLHLLPSVQKEYPHEYDYLLYLIDLYMKQDKAAADAAAALAAEQNGEDSNANKDGQGINLDADDGHGTHRAGDGTDRLGANGMSGNGTDRLPNLDDSATTRGPNCIACIIASLCGALTKCTLFFWKKFSGFLSSFFFLKTDAQKKADKEFEKMQRAADAEEKEEVKKIRADKIAETNLGDNPELLEEELNKKGQFRRKRRTYPHKPSPDWPIVVETMIKSLKDAENDYENRKAANKQPFFIPSIRNICFLIAKILEIYAIASLAFRREVPWGWPGTLHDVLSFPSGSSDLYKMKVWTSLGLSMFYCYIGLISISFAKEGILGADKATRKAGEFPSRGFAHSITLTIFSTTLSVWIIKSFLDLYSCDYHQTDENLFFMPAIECGSVLHHWWLVVASFGLLFYYPVSSFLYPNLQYLNVGNDFKYDTSFVVMFNQAKLIMIAVTVFFPYADEAIIPLIVSTALFIALALINRLLKPNTVRVLNLWETSMYFIAAWIQIGGIIAYFTTDTVLSSTLLLLGIVIILIITFLIHRFRKKIQYEKIPQVERANSQAPLESKPTMEMAKIHHKVKESELPLAPLDRPGLDLSYREGEGENKEEL